MSTDTTMEDLRGQLALVTAERNILRDLILNNHSEAIHHEKVIYGIDDEYQHWAVSLSLYDPLPKDWTRDDLNKPRLTLEQALDAYVADHLKAGASQS